MTDTFILHRNTSLYQREIAFAGFCFPECIGPSAWKGDACNFSEESRYIYHYDI